MKTNYLNKIGSAKATLLAGLFLVASFLGKAQCNANFTYSVGANGYVNVQSTSTGTFSTTHFSWSFGGPATANGPVAGHIFTTNGFKWICLTLSDTINNCTSTWCDTVLVTNATGTANPCNANFTRNYGANGMVTFNSASTGTSLTTHYYWTFSGGGSANGSSVSHTFATNGLKTVCLYITDSLNSCSDNFCDSVLITNAGGNAPCNPTVMYTLSKDSSFALTWNAWPVYPFNVTNATWSWGDGSTSTGLYPSHTYSAAGTYSTCVTISVSCGTVTATYCYVAGIFKSSENNQMITLNVRSSGPTGIKEQSNGNNLLIYPNPNNGSFVIETRELTGDVDQAQVFIYNMLGQTVFEKNVQANTKVNVNASELPEGTYFVKIISGNERYNKKIVVQK